MTTNNDLDYILSIIDKFGGINRLGLLFSTKKNGYYYDNGTGKVILCEPDEYEVFKWLFSRKEKEGYICLCESLCIVNIDEIIKNVKEAIEEENLLQAPIIKEFISPTHKEFFEESLDEGIRMITLELTEKCNLRCDYCVYNEKHNGERGFSSKEMSKETLEAAIEFLAKHGSDEVAVTFYGGEPLLKFDLIKHAVFYSQKILKEKKVSFSMTTNLTLMTKKMADFFASIDNFSIVCSIDGPEHIHDQYRKYADGTGSFNNTIKGLFYLVESYKKHNRLNENDTANLSLSMVFGEPHTEMRITEIQSFFNDLTWLPATIAKQISYPSKGISIDYESSLESRSEQDYFDPLLDWSKAKYAIENKENNFLEGHLERVLLGIHKRPILNEPAQSIGMNGCCVPGHRRLCISTNGDMKPCERMGTCPTIGNVFSGFDKEKMNNVYVNEYESKSVDDCNNCWAFKICGVCYATLYTKNDTLDINHKRKRCNNAKEYSKRLLELYHEYLEENPEMFLHFNDYTIT
ncbi:MAG: radical SAM protein [Lachnospiraceae bacterium]|jgi:uncharacterized protein|nr:radical SAM protein [Lachnospiraceae bacterium]